MRLLSASLSLVGALAVVLLGGYPESVFADGKLDSAHRQAVLASDAETEAGSDADSSDGTVSDADSNCDSNGVCSNSEGDADDTVSAVQTADADIEIYLSSIGVKTGLGGAAGLKVDYSGNLIAGKSSQFSKGSDQFLQQVRSAG